MARILLYVGQPHERQYSMSEKKVEIKRLNLPLMKLGVAAGIGMVLCGCGNDVASGRADGVVLRYASHDGCYRVVGPAWDSAKKIGGEWYFPITVGADGTDECVYWCREVSRGSCGNFAVESRNGDFYLSDAFFGHSDEMKVVTYMDIVSGSATNRIELERAEPLIE